MTIIGLHPAWVPQAEKASKRSLRRRLMFVAVLMTSALSDSSSCDRVSTTTRNQSLPCREADGDCHTDEC